MTRNILQDMNDYLPRYYDGGYIVGNILNRESAELVDLNAALYDVLAQFYVGTATWSLDRWESICGIETDTMKPDDQRRSVILSKLRGVGTVTPDLVKNVAESFDNGEVELTEDNAAYTVEIAFVSSLGIPPNIDDVQQAIRDILPAHLAVNFVFIFVSLGTLEGYGKTLGQIETAGITFGELGTWGG